MNKQLRTYPFLSACGLNCGLCPNHYTAGVSRCSGCGGENFFNPACAILKCNARHGGIEFCFQCSEYPCERYDGADRCDSFITHKNQLCDNVKLQKCGLAVYQSELHEKMKILQFLLDNYNDGRRKSFYCIAINLLELEDIRSVIRQLTSATNAENPIKDKAKFTVHLFEKTAEEKNISLKLRKRSSK